MEPNILPFLDKRHSIKEIDGLVSDLYSQRGDLDINEYTKQCDELMTERREFIHRDKLLALLMPSLEDDAVIARSSFGPLADDYLALRQDLLLTWQPSTIVLTESVTTLARLIFRRHLIHRESGLFYNDKAKRKSEMQEVKALNIEIDRFSESMVKQFARYKESYHG